MTEDEAKTKICHRSIDGDDSPAPVIGNEMFAKNYACIGSACMAWRWIDDPEAMEDEPYEGFCGLAGKP